MCFYASADNLHYACFDCRKMFRYRLPDSARRPVRSRHACPDCGGAMTNIGPYFKAPRRQDVRAWAVARVLASYGITFRPPSCCTWDGPGRRPRDPREVPAFVALETGTDGAGVRAQMDAALRLAKRDSAGRFRARRKN